MASMPCAGGWTMGACWTVLEPYFFDFQGDLYGQRLSVELIDYLRPEAKFDSLDALVAQMDADCARARTILSSHNPA